MFERKPIDTRKYRLIEEGGMIAKHIRYSYASDCFQDVVQKAFGDLVPRIYRDDTGKFFHANHDEESRETISMSREFEPGEPWPEHEERRLLASWKKLHKLTDCMEDDRLRAMLHNLQFPNPRRNKQFYRTYTDIHGVQRMHVLCGFAPVGVREMFTAAHLMPYLHGRLFPGQDYLEDPSGLPMDEVQSAKAARRRLHRRTVSPVLSLACVVSMAAVFMTYSITVIPVLCERQSSVVISVGPDQGLAAKRAHKGSQNGFHASSPLVTSAAALPE